MYYFSTNSEPENHPLNAETKAFVELYQDYLEEHDRSVHDGERCHEERAGLIAFFAHRLGLTVEEWDMVPIILAAYEEHHDASH